LIDVLDTRRPREGGSAVPARRERAAERRHAPGSDFVRSAVRQIEQRAGRRTPGHRFRDHVEILVVPFDPVDRPYWREVFAVVAGDVANLHPDRNVWVSHHDVLDGLERAVNVA
jgi:hypothetical protein